MRSSERDDIHIPIDDPARIDWPARQSAALIPFRVIDGRPVNPCEKTGITTGRGQLRHWGEQVCADAIVTATTPDGRRWLLMIERGDWLGWALPGGKAGPGEAPAAAATRELAEETGLTLPSGIHWTVLPARYVPDPRASDEAWMVTVPCRADLGTPRHGLPYVVGDDDARQAEWIPADSYATLTAHLAHVYTRPRVFAAHEAMLREVLDA